MTTPNLSPTLARITISALSSVATTTHRRAEGAVRGGEKKRADEEVARLERVVRMMGVVLGEMAEVRR